MNSTHKGGKRVVKKRANGGMRTAFRRLGIDLNGCRPLNPVLSVRVVSGRCDYILAHPGYLNRLKSYQARILGEDKRLPKNNR